MASSPAARTQMRTTVSGGRTRGKRGSSVASISSVFGVRCWVSVIDMDGLRSGVGRVTGRARVGFERGVGAGGAVFGCGLRVVAQGVDELLDARVGGGVDEQLITPGL